MQPQNGTANYAKEYTIISMMLVLVMLVLCWLLFAFNIPIGSCDIIAPAAIVVCFTAIRIHRYAQMKTRFLSACALMAVTIVSVLVSYTTFDTSYDGMAYHQVAIIALKSGWDPVYAPHLVAWWNATFPDAAWLARTVADNGLWTDHYPKAAWVLGAIMASATNSLNTSKWLHFFLATSAATAMYRGLAVVGVPRAAAALLGIVAALSPVAIVQTGTNYVDGLLASAVLIQVGAALAWTRTTSSEDLFVMIAGFIIATNLKFTGLVYSSILFAFVVGLALQRQKKLSSRELIVCACGVVALLIVSSQTYVLNLAEQGSPFYPLNKIDVVAPNINHGFLALGRLEKFFISLFSITSNSIEVRPVPELFVPRLWHYYALSHHGAVDTRMNGFGSLFGWSLLASAGGLLVCLCSRASRASLSQSGLSIMVLLAATLASAIINPELWWARYVPQLWLVPILVSAFAFMAGRQYLGGLMSAPMVAGSALCLVYCISNTIDEQHRIGSEFTRLAMAGHAQLLDGWSNNHGVFTFAFHEKLDGVDVRFASVQSGCPNEVRIGIVAVCHGTR